MRQLPFITITLCVLSTGLMFHPAVDNAVLYYDSALLAKSNFWGLLTGHLIHVDTSHWFWNTLALAVLGVFLETRSSKLMALSLLAGVAAVDVLLLSPLAGISQYCGLSGVLNTLLGVALYCYWLDTRSRWVILASVLSVGKVLLELFFDTALLTSIAWPPYPPAHLAGLVGACVLLLVAALCAPRMTQASSAY